MVSFSSIQIKYVIDDYSQLKHMLWVLKMSSFDHPKYMFKFIGMGRIAILHSFGFPYFIPNNTTMNS